MAVNLICQSAGFQITGDGVATSCSLSLSGFPFLNCPKIWRAATVSVNANGNGNISAAAINGNMVDLTFNSAFSGASGNISLDFTFDLPR